MKDLKIRWSDDPEVRREQERTVERARKRREKAYQLKENGLTYSAIGDRLGVSRQRAKDLIDRHIELAGG